MRTLGGVIALWCTVGVAAHEGVHERIDAVTKEITQHPHDAALYLKRGEFYREHKDWDAALADFERAATLEPDHSQLDFVTARVLLDAGWTLSATERIERHLRRFPDDAMAQLVHARALAATNRFGAAAQAYEAAIRRLDAPRPDDYLERARLLALAGREHVAEAIACLDEAVARLGAVPSFLTAAIELETQLGRHDAALARVDQLLSQSRRQERWLSLRGMVLERAGRADEARAAYAAALQAIEALPARHRGVDVIAELEQDVRASIARLRVVGSTEGD